MTEPIWNLRLTKYQRDNLLWLLVACMGQERVEPFHLANTGDWIGEIGWMLADQDTLPGGWHTLGDADRPNIDLDELRKRVAFWLQQP